jgi:hypothetical protein
MIPVEGVTTKPKTLPQEPVQPLSKLTAKDVWEVRAKALSAALMGNHVNFNAEQVVTRAQVFERYILTGGPDALPVSPSVSEQIARQFATLTGSLDGNPV